MSEAAERSEGPAIGALHEVRATFDDPDAMQEAVARLEMSGFDRADLSQPEAVPPAERATPEVGARPVDTEEDARQTRTLNTGGAAAAVGMAAAGVVIATGGAAVPAVAAAVVGAGVAGGVAYAISTASSDDEQADREQKANERPADPFRARAQRREARRSGNDPASGGWQATGGAVMPTRTDDEKDENSIGRSRTAFPRAIRRPTAGSSARAGAPRTSASAPRAGPRQPPKGTPTHERHATETAHQGENEDQPPN